MTVTLHFQSTGTIPGSGKPFTMVGNSISIGRSDANDLVLPDPEKVVSGSHCSVEDHGGNIVVVDLSTNGTFLNYGKLALGNTPTPLNDGDILSIGTYEILVDIRTAQTADPLDDIADPLAAAPISHGDANAIPDTLSLLDDTGGEVDFLDDLLGGPGLQGPAAVERDILGDDGLMPPLGIDNGDLLAPMEDPNANLGASHSAHSSSLEDHFITPAPATSAIPDDWDIELDIEAEKAASPAVAPEPGIGAPVFIPDDIDDLDDFAAVLDEEPAHEPPPVPKPEPVAPVIEPAVDTATPPALEPAPAPDPDPESVVAQPTAVSDPATRAFLEAAGMQQGEIADDDLVETMSRMGTTMRIMVEGMRDILMTRTSIKSEFRINQTVIASGGNNPLKFSVSAEQAVKKLVKPAEHGFLDSDIAAKQAFDDIKAHEVAVMTGVSAAIKGILASLSPVELEKIIREDTGFRSVLTNKKARYWDVFEKRYEKIANQAENDFHEVFAKEFARAYQEQLERLK